MLQIVIPAIELWDESKEEFVTYQKEQTLQLEHSLVSLSKWEEVWCKPFLETEELTYEETLDYIKFMTLTKNVDPSVYERLTRGQMKQITDYIKAPRTATTFTTQSNSGGKKERITSELVYYWMFYFSFNGNIYGNDRCISSNRSWYQRKDRFCNGNLYWRSSLWCDVW